MIEVWRRRRGEEGAVALLVALSLVGLCVVAGLVIDLGLLRVDRQVDKSAQDAASLAGVDGLISSINDPVLHPFAGVCQAMHYLMVNDDRFSSFATSAWSNGLGGSISGNSNGCDSSHSTDVCAPSNPTTWARWVGTTSANSDGALQVTIQSGYKTVETNTATDGNLYSVTGGAFSEESLSAYSGDPGAAAYGGCDQLGVIVSQVRATSLGAAAASHMGTRIRSVARIKITPPTTPFALLILDRTACLALANMAGGTINVTGYKTNPGLIHVDSDGKGVPARTGFNCTSKPAIQGAKPSGVVAHEAPIGGAPGEISIVAGSNISDGTGKVWAGPAPGTDPNGNASLVTRSVLDSIYQTGVQAAVSAAKPFVNATVAPSGWFTVASCPSSPTTYTQTQIFFNCSNLNKNVSMPNATDVIIAGRVSADLSMPKARRLYIKGVSSPAGVTVSGTFEINNQTHLAPCPTTSDSSLTRAQMFIGTGALKVTGGKFIACNTTLIMMGGDTSTACVPSGSPTYFEDGNVCPTSATPTGPGNGSLAFSGGAGIDWTAPDLVDDEIPASATDHANLEDLALWTETSGDQGIGGGGSLHLMGVFAVPNGDLKLNGTSTSQVANSQYIARTLNTTGTGTLTLTPLPSLPVAPPKITYFLIR